MKFLRKDTDKTDTQDVDPQPYDQSNKEVSQPEHQGEVQSKGNVPFPPQDETGEPVGEVKAAVEDQSEVKTAEQPKAKSKPAKKKTQNKTTVLDLVRKVLVNKADVLAHIEGKSTATVNYTLANIEEVYKLAGEESKKTELTNCKSCNQGKVNRIFRNYLAWSHQYLNELGYLKFWKEVRATLSEQGLQAAIEKAKNVK